MDQRTKDIAAWLQHLTSVVMHLSSAAHLSGSLNEQDAKGIAEEFEALAKRIDAAMPDDQLSSFAPTLHAIAQLLRQ